MDPQTLNQQPPVEHTFENPITPGRRINWLFVIITVIGFFSVLTAGYFLGTSSQKTKTDEIAAVPSPTEYVMPTAVVEPTQIVVQPTSVLVAVDTGIPIKEDTISFARANDGVYIRYANEIYKDGVNGTEKIDKVDSNSLSWIGLVNEPVAQNYLSPVILAIKNFPDKNKFIFTSRMMHVNEKNLLLDQLNLYLYNPYENVNKLTKLAHFEPTGSNYSYPISIDLSPDEKFVQLYMHGCMNCGGGPLETLLIRIADGAQKRIGITSFFEWKNNGIYRYRIYKEIPTCKHDTPVPCDPDTSVPIKTEAF